MPIFSTALRRRLSSLSPPAARAQRYLCAAPPALFDIVCHCRRLLRHPHRTLAVTTIVLLVHTNGSNQHQVAVYQRLPPWPPCAATAHPRRSTAPTGVAVGHKRCSSAPAISGRLNYAAARTPPPVLILDTHGRRAAATNSIGLSCSRLSNFVVSRAWCSSLCTVFVAVLLFFAVRCFTSTASFRKPCYVCPVN